MNNTRREELRAILSTLETAMEALDVIKGDEEEYRDNIPENLYGSIRYEVASEAVGNMEYALDELESVCSSITSAIDGE